MWAEMAGDAIGLAEFLLMKDAMLLAQPRYRGRENRTAAWRTVAGLGQVCCDLFIGMPFLCHREDDFFDLLGIRKLLEATDRNQNDLLGHIAAAPDDPNRHPVVVA